jgi:hypothetical protein
MRPPGRPRGSSAARGAATVLIHLLPEPVGTPELVAGLGDEDVSTVLLVGPVDPGGLLAFTREPAWRDPRPTILAPGAIAGMLLAAPASEDLGAPIVAWPMMRPSSCCTPAPRRLMWAARSVRCPRISGGIE